MLTQKKRSILLLAIFCLSALFALTINHAAHAASKQQAGWTLVWSDEFNGAGQPSSTNWNYDVGNGFNPGAGSFDGWGNGEWEWYRPENCAQSNGSLAMKGEYRTTATTIAGRQWYQFSCRITSDTKRSIQYGAIEARIQMPNIYGTWPAFWMMGDACDDTSTSNYGAAMSYYDTMASNWASFGEVDIVEHRNTESLIFNNLFWDTRTGLFPWSGTTVANNPVQYNLGNVATFHTYRLEWTSTQMKWLVDGITTKTQDISPANMEEFRKPFHLIMNLAISGQFTGNAQPNQAQFPLYMNVDYVRVYSAGGGTATTPAPTTPSGTCTGDFQQGVSNSGSTSGLVWFKPCGYTAGYVILHYIRPGLAQQNINMTYNSGAGRWEYNVTGMAAGQTLQYQFTYQKAGVQYDSSWFSWVHP